MGESGEGEVLLPSSFTVGERVDVQGEKATVKFIGYIKKDEDTKKIVEVEEGDLWLGLEWDDKERGKHSGEGLFEVGVPGSGSFVKAAKVTRAFTLLQTVEEKYNDILGNAAEPTDMFVPTAKDNRVGIELVGRDKAINRYKNLHLLKTVSLDHSKAGKVGNAEETAEKLKVLEELDVSHSLFSDWMEVEKLGLALPTLRALQLNRCRISLPAAFPVEASPLSQLKVIALNRTGLSFKQVCTACTRLPQLEALHIANNQLTNLSDAADIVNAALASVKVIDMDGNEISEWREVATLAKLPNLKKLILSDNKLTDVEAEEGDFAALENLSLSGNKLDDWKCTIPMLHFKHLTEAKLSRTPMFESLASSAAHRTGIARIPTLKMLNRSEIGAVQRDEAERFYLSRWAGGWDRAKAEGEEAKAAFLAEHPTYSKIMARLGEIQVIGTVADGPRTMMDEVVELNFVSELSEKKHKKKLPPTTGIGAVKALGARLFKLELDNTTFRYYNEGAEHFPEPLNEDFRTLDYYGIVSGATVLVEAK
uniref:CAP-Gly domain-containing protein n=2 Tax=Palpitomonas bilix TaxID=652834 RepID=A0A7S3G8X5_9EUKA|mmetsp:Transcript_29337/g.75627  ORF Transcript_29337/g.75627 Transcript_29337/m.75627 type:complete len:537 (+) Transcript_29337:130-1740(+)